MLQESLDPVEQNYQKIYIALAKSMIQQFPTVDRGNEKEHNLT